MKLSERVLIAKETIGLSIRQIGLILDISDGEVRELYKQERINRMNNANLNSPIDVLYLDSYTINRLKRSRVHTIKSLVDYKTGWFGIPGCCTSTVQRIADVIPMIQSVLKLKGSDLLRIFGIYRKVKLNFVDAEENLDKVMNSWTASVGNKEVDVKIWLHPHRA